MPADIAKAILTQGPAPGPPVGVLVRDLEANPVAIGQEIAAPASPIPPGRWMEIAAPQGVGGPLADSQGSPYLGSPFAEDVWCSLDGGPAIRLRVGDVIPPPADGSIRLFTYGGAKVAVRAAFWPASIGPIRAMAAPAARLADLQRAGVGPTGRRGDIETLIAGVATGVVSASVLRLEALPVLDYLEIYARINVITGTPANWLLCAEPGFLDQGGTIRYQDAIGASSQWSAPNAAITTPAVGSEAVITMQRGGADLAGGGGAAQSGFRKLGMVPPAFLRLRAFFGTNPATCEIAWIIRGRRAAP